MEPANHEQTQSWAPPPGMQWGGPPSSMTPPPAPNRAALPSQARPGLIILAAVLTELVLIAGLANQGISGQIDDDLGGTSFWRLVERSWLTYRWRFTPHSGLTTQWGSQLALIATTLVLTALLVLVLVRGAVTFWRAFFGTWLAVLGASLIGGFVRGLVDTDTYRAVQGGGASRMTVAVFGPLGPTQIVVVAAFMLGLVTGLVAGAVATLTRHPAYPAAAGAPVPAPYVAPEPPPPYYGEAPAAPQPPWQEQRFEPHGSPYGMPAAPPPAAPPPSPPPPSPSPPAGAPPLSGEPTTQLPPAPTSGEPTTQLPRTPMSGEPTSQFPRPPDDEDLH